MTTGGSGQGQTGNLTYFRPGEVTLLLEPLTSADDPRTLLWDATHRQALIDASNLGSLGRQLDTNPFQQSRQRPDRNPIIMDRVGGTQILQTVNLQGWLPEEDINPANAAVALRDVAAAVDEVNSRARSGNPVPIARFRIIGASPNWWGMPFITCGCGCPGGLPQPPETKTDPPHFNPNVSRKKLPRFRPVGGGAGGGDQVAEAVALALESAEDSATNARGEHVTVVVFDTWPMIAGNPDPLAKMAAIHDRMQAEMGPIAAPDKAEILRFHKAAKDGGVVGRGDILDYVTLYSSAPERLPCRHRSCDCRLEPEVEMPDHGLFVADIIRDIAPAATLKVYRVLSDRGMGEVDTIARAVEEVIAGARADPSRPVVLNMSLGFGPQMRMMIDLLSNPIKAFEGGETWICEQMNEIWHVSGEENPTRHDLVTAGLLVEVEPGRYEFRGALAHLQWLLSPASLPPNVLIVAAAGNDSCGPRKAPPRLPAAVEGILGVSALDANLEPAHYSNLDDLVNPPDDGVGAFGGAANEGGQTTDGIVGLYVSDRLPAGSATVNQFGWAIWAGTSFATPIVSGFIACLWSEMWARAGGTAVTPPSATEVIARVPKGRMDLRQRL